MAEMNNKINLLLVRAQARRRPLPAGVPERVLPDPHPPARRDEGPGQRPAPRAGPAADRPGSRGKPVPEQAAGDLESARGIETGPNPAARYYPGDGCTDMIGNDMFSSSVGGGSFEENQALYDAHPRKPYSLPEWGLEGVDDPAFVEKICAFIKTHRRTEMAAYYESRPGSIYDLGDKPKSRAVYRALHQAARPPAAGLAARASPPARRSR